MHSSIIKTRKDGFGAVHEAEAFGRFWLLGVSAGRAVEHKRSVALPEGTGIGDRWFGRVTLTWEVK